MQRDLSKELKDYGYNLEYNLPLVDGNELVGGVRIMMNLLSKETHKKLSDEMDEIVKEGKDKGAVIILNELHNAISNGVKMGNDPEFIERIIVKEH